MPSSTIKSLVSDKTPFLLAILLAGLAWCVNHVADRAKELPIVEYSHFNTARLPVPVEQLRLCPASAGATPYAYLVRNISARHAFKDLNLYFYSQSGAAITEARWLNKPPGIAEQTTRPCNVQEAGRAFVLRLEELQWSWNGIVLVWSKDTQPPLLLYRAADDSTPKAKSNVEVQSVLFLESNLTTAILRNEFYIYYGLIAFFFFLICCYVGVYVYRN